eukprot:GHVR01037106.1.p1 GENE.GHVR01037106.1~~GHVR01037106.1.p1  ORF type:complete len:108 (-),score=6.95 GHVR01037106.1:285-608(-)
MNFTMIKAPRGSKALWDTENDVWEINLPEGAASILIRIWNADRSIRQESSRGNINIAQVDRVSPQIVLEPEKVPGNQGHTITQISRYIYIYIGLPEEFRSPLWNFAT